jgi:hypothetical protein
VGTIKRRNEREAKRPKLQVCTWACDH